MIALVFAGHIQAQDAPVPFPQGGVLDLRKTPLDQKSLYSLNGEWIFYWEKLITPENYRQEKRKASGILVKVPSYFSNYEIGGSPLPGKGYGTYSLTILLPENSRSPICFDIPVFDVAFRFYLNDLLIGSSGTVGTSRDEEVPWYEPSSFCYMPHSDTLQLLVQISNFHHRRGGFWKAIFMGGPEKVQSRMERNRMYNYSTIGILFFFTFFFVIFWLFSRGQTIMLLFALTALGILIRSVNTGLYFSNAFVYAPWSWQIRMEYLGSYMAFVFGMMFLHRTFPMPYMKPVVLANTILFTLAGVSLFLLPVEKFSYEMLLFQPLVLIFLLHYLVISLIGIFRKRIMDAVFFVSLAFFIYTLVNDILLANSAGAIYNNYLSQVSFQLFIFAMAVMIIMQWVRNYEERIHLESSLRFKNKVLSVIAHDLKNPVASVAQFVDLLVTKPELAGDEKILNSLQESSQAAVYLLDNLLYWGRSQSDELKLSRVNFEIEPLFREVESLFLHMALQKELKIQTGCRPGISVYADRALVNMVIRNLVSNAIKFTPRNGTVKIIAQQEGNMVRFSVTDTGIGIAPEILKKLEAEGHVDSSAGTEREVGTGLGLQLVKDLVEKNGGILTIESQPDAGSTFTFTLPTSI